MTALDWMVKIVDIHGTIQPVGEPQPGVIMRTQVVWQVVCKGTVGGTAVEFGFATKDDKLVEAFKLGEPVRLKISLKSGPELEVLQ